VRGIKRIYMKMNRIEIKIILYLFLVIPIFLIYTGCSFSSFLSDEEAVKLVEDHYLFFFGGEKVQAKVIERGEYIKKYDCYPIKFKITFSNSRNNSKTLYFYKNSSGKIAVRQFIG